MLEVAPSGQPGTPRRQQLPGNATGWVWTGLDPDTEYDVSLLPESNEEPMAPQRLRVRTLPAPGGSGTGGGANGRGAGHAGVLGGTWVRGEGMGVARDGSWEGRGMGRGQYAG